MASRALAVINNNRDGFKSDKQRKAFFAGLFNKMGISKGISKGRIKLRNYFGSKSAFKMKDGQFATSRRIAKGVAKVKKSFSAIQEGKKRLSRLRNLSAADKRKIIAGLMEGERMTMNRADRVRRVSRGRMAQMGRRAAAAQLGVVGGAIGIAALGHRRDKRKAAEKKRLAAVRRRRNASKK